MQAVAPTSTTLSAEAVKTPKPAVRNVAVDAYRGLVMLLMMGEVLRFAQVARNFPGNWFWGILAWNQTHVEWAGMSLHDTIQPSFSFLVGVALPYSIASRLVKGGTFGKLFAHALWRSFLLIALGVFLRSMYHPMTNFTFEDTLSQIGMGYPFLFLLGFKPPKWAWIALAVILVGYWGAWALYPVAPPDYNWSAVGVPPGWGHLYTGFMAHWNKNANLGQAFDVWFLNLFPRPKPFVANDGGYLTLSFIPTLGTMILGLICGRWLREAAPKIPMKKLIIAGVVGVALGAALHFAGICPEVKRIWTPTWTIFSGGVCFLFVAAFSWFVDILGFKKTAYPLIVVGMNSIAAYLIAHLFENFIQSSLRTNLGQHWYDVFGTGVGPFVEGAVILTIFWLILFWMYRRKLFLKI